LSSDPSVPAGTGSSAQKCRALRLAPDYEKQPSKVRRECTAGIAGGHYLFGLAGIVAGEFHLRRNETEGIPVLIGGDQPAEEVTRLPGSHDRSPGFHMRRGALCEE